MNRQMTGRLLRSAAAAVITISVLAVPALATTSGPSDVAAPLAGLPTLPCDPQGANSRDGQLAATLNGELTGTLADSMTAYRTSCARVVVKAVHDRGLSERAAVIAITTTIVESTLKNVDGGDATSIGLFQQQNGWGSRENRLKPVWAANAFLDAMEHAYPGGSWQTAPIGDVCQEVQRSGHPDRYAPQAADAQRIVARLWDDQPVDEAARGPLWNRTRWAAGTWDTSATKVDGSMSLTDTAVASVPNRNMYAFNVVKGSGIWYRGRTAAGVWAASATQIDTNPNITAVAATGLNDGTLHVFAIVPGSGVWHRTRAVDGTWSNAALVDTNPYTVAIAAAALPNGTLSLFTAVPGSGVWVRDRATTGTWAASATHIDSNPYITSVAATGLPNGTLHVFNLVSGSGVWYRSRTVGGTWAAAADPIDLNDSVSSVSAAGLPDGTLHVTTVVPGNGIWDRTRSAAGTFSNATRIDTNPKAFGTYTAGLNNGTLQIGALIDVT
ncbi:hypothetical protein [Kutzneria sp. 744]|uniref:hypothetical protein n=1 Tax=Kutzneria sp. (strain 744) TaxID=345341 RepID=UPI0012FB3653|nr:hypothetical protein [Kutzneria sp. 744]